jgi:membrane-associated phospholipid phosphatase
MRGSEGWQQFLGHVRALAAIAGQLGRRWWLRFLMVQGLALSVTWWLLRPFDDLVLKGVLHAPGVENYQAIKPVARVCSALGDYTCFTVVAVVGLWWLGAAKERYHWRRVAVACLLSASLSGVSAVMLRASLGRARPISKLPDTFYGPTTEAVQHAFPSGHTATAVGTALPLMLALPRLRAVALGVAVATGWSRMHLRQHRPTDIAGGIWEAVWFGVPLGLAARRLQRREELDRSLERGRGRGRESAEL